MACFLKQLSINSDHNPFIGLHVSYAECKLDPRYFPCCATKGYFLTKDNDVVHCSLGVKLKLLSELSLAIKEKPSHVSQLRLGHFWKWLSDYKHQRVFKGGVIAKEEVLAFAFMARWRFDLEIRIFSVGRDSVNVFLKALYASTSDHPPIVLVCGAHRAWSPEEFSMLINSCEKGLLPLWLSFAKESSPHLATTGAKQGTTLGQFRDRLSKKTVCSFLSESDQSRLGIVCEGWN